MDLTVTDRARLLIVEMPLRAAAFFTGFGLFLTWIF